MDEHPDTGHDLVRLLDELAWLDARRVDIGEGLVRLEYLYASAGAREQAEAARRAFHEQYVGRIYELADGLRS